MMGCYNLKESPYQNTSVGMARVVRLEMSHSGSNLWIRTKYPDITASVITKKLLQFEANKVWDHKGSATNMLWSTELDLSYEKGYCFVPRLVRNKVRNDRYNSATHHKRSKPRRV